MSNQEAQAFTREMLSLLACIEDVGGSLLDETRRYCAMKERITTVELECLPVGRSVVCAPSVGFILDDLGMLDAWRN